MMNLKNTLFLFLVITIVACNSSKMKTNIKSIDVQGHRGCRGLLPENTIMAFEKALDLGVTTLEMDLVISNDNKVVVSHEPFFNHEISTGPNNQEISEAKELTHNLYKLSYDQIMAYDVGVKAHIRFPDQKNVAAHKPLFLDVVEMAENHSVTTGRSLPYYNIEIKRKPDTDGEFHPDAKTFAKLVVNEVQSTGIQERIYIQSFDVASLQAVKDIDSSIKLVLLIYNQDTPQSNLDKLGFTPEVYSPYYELVNEELVSFCKTKNMQLIPWTVNENPDLNKMLELGVDGIITDYPDRLVKLIKENRSFDIM